MNHNHAIAGRMYVELDCFRSQRDRPFERRDRVFGEAFVGTPVRNAERSGTGVGQGSSGITA